MFSNRFSSQILNGGYNTDLIDIQYNEDYRDTVLSSFGVEQAKYASKYANMLDIDLVLISPMRRTMQTAYYLLRNHPNKESMKYVVHPGIREHIFGFSEMTDNWSEKFENQYQCYFPNLDASLMKTPDGEYDELFYLRDIQLEIRKNLDTSSKHELEQMVKKSSIERFPRSGELLEGTVDRVQQVKKYINKYLKNRLPEDQYKKVLVITHSLLLKVWIGNWKGMTRPYKGLPEDALMINN